MRTSERKAKRAGRAAIQSREGQAKGSPEGLEALTAEEQDLLTGAAAGSWTDDMIRAGRDGGNFMDPPDEATRRRQARRRELAKAGRPVIRVTLPEPTRPLTPEQEAQLAHFDHVRKMIGKVDFSVAGLIRELRDGGTDIHR